MRTITIEQHGDKWVATHVGEIGQIAWGTRQDEVAEAAYEWARDHSTDDVPPGRDVRRGADLSALAGPVGIQGLTAGY